VKSAVNTDTAKIDAPKVDASKPDTSKEIVAEPGIRLSWPAKGKVSDDFSEKTKGIDIAGKLGEPVTAASDGKVVYAGNSLRGYGNLVIIKHDNTYLTAYAHNRTLLVKEGDTVKRGQKIAEMGDTDANAVKLHFELRVNGKPVNPTPYLQ
jgi:lipoprotein NlpD